MCFQITTGCFRHPGQRKDPWEEPPQLVLRISQLLISLNPFLNKNRQDHLINQLIVFWNQCILCKKRGGERHEHCALGD